MTNKQDPFEDVIDDPEFKEYLSLQRNIGQNKTKHVWSDDINGPKDDAQNRKRHHRSRPKKKSTKTKPEELFVHTLKAKGFPAEARRKNVIEFFKPIKPSSIRINKKDGICFVSFNDSNDLRFALRKDNQFWDTSRIKLWRHDIFRSRLYKEAARQKQEPMAKSKPFERRDVSNKDSYEKRQREPNTKAESVERMTSNFKRDKLFKQKEAAPKASNWNILFLGQNALADVVSESRGIDKSKLLLQQSHKDPIAVRMALGDANAVEEMRKFLIVNGIELDSFDNPQAPRSKTVMLVKNLPSSTNKEDLQLLFEQCGQVGRIVMPPNGLTAIVEMEQSREARYAFKKLAYNKFKDSVLYLEWAPINVFREKSIEEQDKDEMEQLLRAQTGTKILVKNVPFEATVHELKKVFSTYGELNFIRLPKKIDGSHRGFAFADYLTREDALRAFRALCHSTHLYGRKLVLEWAKNDDQQQQSSFR